MILVTGGLGFIGTHVTRALLDLGESCVVPWRRSAERAKLLGAGQGELVLERLDVLDGEALLDLGKRYPITGVTHLAGVGLGAVPTLDALSGNVQALVNVLRAADAWGVSRVGVASTIGVYGGVAGNPLHEDMPLPAESPHMIPAAKKAMEILALRAAADAGYDVVNLRIGAIWGPLGRNDSPFFPIPRMVHAAVAGEDPGFPPDRVPYAESGIDACYVKDCARAIALLQTAPALRHHTYNVGNGYATTNGEIAAAIRALIPDARTGVAEGGPGDPLHLDTTRLREDTGFRPSYDAGRAVGDYVGWLRAGHTR